MKKFGAVAVAAVSLAGCSLTETSVGGLVMGKALNQEQRARYKLDHCFSQGKANDDKFYVECRGDGSLFAGTHTSHLAVLLDAEDKIVTVVVQVDTDSAALQTFATKQFGTASQVRPVEAQGDKAVRYDWNRPRAYLLADQSRDRAMLMVGVNPYAKNGGP